VPERDIRNPHSRVATAIPTLLAGALLLLVAGAAHATPYRGYAVMFPAPVQPGGGTVWSQEDPYGNDLSAICPGTSTQCLQEMISLAIARGWPLHVYGGGYQMGVPGKPIYTIEASSTIQVPPSIGWVFRAYGVYLNLHVTGGPGIRFDSQAHPDWEWDGMVYYSVTSANISYDRNGACAVMHSPENPALAGLVETLYGRIRFSHIYGQGNGLGLFCLNLNPGQVRDMDIDLGVLNGQSQMAFGYVVFGQQPAPSGSCCHHVKILYINATTNSGIDIGVFDQNPGQIGNTVYDVVDVEPTAGAAITTWASNDIWRIGLIALDFDLPFINSAITIEQTAQNNQFQCGNIQAFADQQKIWNFGGPSNSYPSCQ
jgi:hypothetical protein